jgi:uncharacterized damage-inducible protein DinB
MKGLASRPGSGTDLLLENGLFQLDFARKVTDSMLADIPDDQWCLQAVPGANHTMWIVGHLAWNDDFFLTRLAGRQTRFPKGWQDLFATGSQPALEPGSYPAPQEVQQQLAERRQELTSSFESLGGAELRAPVPTELQRYAANVADVMPSIAWHEAWHVGQLSLVRRVLGLGLKFG